MEKLIFIPYPDHRSWGSCYFIGMLQPDVTCVCYAAICVVIAAMRSKKKENIEEIAFY